MANSTNQNNTSERPLEKNELRKKLSCRFFNIGRCHLGQDCEYEHVNLQARPERNGQSSGSSLIGCEKPASNDYPWIKQIKTEQDVHDFVLEYPGATVYFGPGAGVLDVKLASDVSSIQILGLRGGIDVEDVSKFLKSMKIIVSSSFVSIRAGEIDKPTVEIKTNDTCFANAVVDRFVRCLAEGRFPGVSTKMFLNGASSGEFVKEPTLHPVRLKWDATKMLVRLHFSNFESADKAMKIIKDEDAILDCEILCSLEEPSLLVVESQIEAYILVVSNIVHLAEWNHLWDILIAADIKPANVEQPKLDPLWAVKSLEECTTTWEYLLSYGKLKAITIDVDHNIGKMGAAIVFKDMNRAVEAVRYINESARDLSKHSEFSVALLNSAHIPVPDDIYTKICKELDPYWDDILEESKPKKTDLHLNNPSLTYKYTTICEEDLTALADSKAATEKLIRGKKVMENGNSVWDPFFVTTPGLVYLMRISSKYNLHIYPDARKLHLAIYGGIKEDQVAAEQELVAKVESLKQRRHTIILTREYLSRAKNGGLLRIQKALREAATLYTIGQSPSILIEGSVERFETAKAILECSTLYPDVSGNHDTGYGDNNETLCPICWNEPELPEKLPCGHTYCESCIIYYMRAVNTTTTFFPIRCPSTSDILGGAPCNTPFPYSFLLRLLAPSTLSHLLSVSYTAYLRSRPQEFQACPTPSCEGVTRIMCGWRPTLERECEEMIVRCGHCGRKGPITCIVHTNHAPADSNDKG